MGLLTDISIKAILGQTQYTIRGHPFPSSRQPLLKARAVADAEHSLALKAVAEWADETCTDNKHQDPNSGAYVPVSHRECPDCIAEFFDGIGEGKMAGEEK